jgi:hypothetical protein
MNDSTTAARNRRLFLGAGGALALGAATSAEAAKGATIPKSQKFSITRVRYGCSAEAHPPASGAGQTFVLPFDTTQWTDSNSDTTLDATNNYVTIQNSGLYRVSLCVDWPGQQGTDTALRTYGIRRRKAGSPPIQATPGQLTQLPDTDEHLATQDITGSSAPQTVRYPQPGSAAVHWTPGTIPLGGRVHVDVTMPVAGVVGPGDVALASLTSINDAALGVAATTALILDAKVVAADTVRVTLFNPTIAAGVNVPQGALTVLGMSAQNRVGESADGWTVLHTTMQQFYRGDMVYATFLSQCPNDYMQTSTQLFLQFDKWVKG